MTDRWSKNLISFAVYMLVAVGFLGLDRLGWANWLKNGFGVVANPVTETIYSASLVLSKPAEMVRVAFLGVSKIENLEMRLAELSVDSTELESLREENKAMRRLLSAPVPIDWELVPVRVVGRAERLSVGFDIGEDIKEGWLVVDEVGVLVGKIETVTDRVAKAELPIGVGVEIPVQVVGKQTEGVLVGDGKKMEFNQVLQEESLAIGDTLATSGRDGEYEVGVVVGRVVGVFGEASDVYKKAKVEALTDYKSLRTVFVVRSNNE